MLKQVRMMINISTCAVSPGNTLLMWDLHPLGNIIEFHPPFRWSSNDSDFSGHDQRLVLLFAFLVNKLWI